MATLFSSNESTSLERDVDISNKESNLNEIWTTERLDECKQWILDNNYTKVCLQFPDKLLMYSARIANDLRLATTPLATGSSVELYILGDTSYGSCCVDEIAASHINADAIIHFGHACLSEVTRLPLHYVFPNFTINTLFLDHLRQLFPDKTEKIMIFYNIGYFYNLDKIKEMVIGNYENAKIGILALNEKADVLCWKLEDQKEFEDYSCIYIGEDDQTLFNLTISLTVKSWHLFDSQEPLNSTANNNKITIREIKPTTTNWMRRRYYYVEKCKDAQTLGIVVGTLTAKGYLNLVKHIQNLARNRGIRTYLISVGKVNPSKLANFMEIDCFVLIGCSENNLFTSRDFYKPLLSVFEVELALNPSWQNQIPDNYSLDFKELLPNGRLHREFEGVEFAESDVSLVTGQIRGAKLNNDDDKIINTNDLTVQTKKNYQLMENDTASSLRNRSWAGLDPALGKNDPAKIEKGRSGLSIKYYVEEEEK